MNIPINLNKLFHFAFVLISILFFSSSLFAQQTILYRSKTFAVKADTIKIDTLSIVSNSVIVQTKFKKNISDSTYTIDFYKSKLTWKKKPKIDSVIITYTLLPFNFSEKFYHKDYSLFNRTDSIMHSGFFYSVPKNKNSIFDLGGVNYNGSFARGISFGNNQDVVVNSNFNLQMQGMLPGGVQVNAALTDNNIPIQPDGNTQQLQDFDKVYIQLKKNHNSLTVGDFEMTKPNGYFLNYYKKSQGFLYEGDYNVSKQWKGYTKGGFAVAKGKYARNSFNGQEGNQGPYKLSGANGETFIIILSGSEKVYIDGIQQQRGSDADYVIDYNTGEVTFTPKRLITSDLRIQVEFQYSDKNYFRTSVTGTQEFSNKKWDFRINLYSEQDSKNQPVQQDLDSLKRNKLASVGDSIQQAYVLSIDSTGYTVDKILYAKKIDPTYGEYYQYSIHPDSALYSLQFSFVGFNKGHYQIAKTAANGRVYQWNAPIDNILQGAYEPYILLIAPQSQQMITGYAGYKPDENTLISIEAALSNKDLNTFSEISNNDNSGLATYFTASKKFKLQPMEKNPLILSVTTRYEYNNKNFKPVENYRALEFDRDWNSNTLQKATDFHNAFADIMLKKNKAGFLQYQFGVLNRESNYTGYQHLLNAQVTQGRIEFNTNNSYTTSQSVINRTSFLRPSMKFAYLLGKKKSVSTGFLTKLEENQIFNTNSDTLSNISYRWNQYGFFLKNSDTAKVFLGAEYTRRNDAKSFKNIFKQFSYSDNISFNSQINFTENHHLAFNFTYRRLHILDSILTAQKEDESMVGRADYNVVIKGGFVTISSLYQFGSGLEQKQEFTYVQVPAGQGVFAYISDYNGNGVKDLNEFDVAPFSDQAEYIKVFIPTNNYIKAFTNQFSAALSIQPRVKWQRAKGVKKFLARFGNTFSTQLDNKLIHLNLLEAANPFQFNVNDSILVTNNSLISDVVSFNRMSPFYGIDANWQRNTNKSLLNNGYESRALTQYGLRLRCNLTKRWSYQQQVEYKLKDNFSQFYVNRKYKIISQSAEPKISYQSKTNARITASYYYEQAHNGYADANDKFHNNKWSLECRFGKLSKSLLNAKVSYAKIKFNGPSNSPVQYALLEGLQNGNNILWNLTYDRKLSKVLELSLSYDGRKTGTANTVHVGRAQLRALF